MICFKPTKDDALFTIERKGGFCAAEATAQDAEAIEEALSHWTLEIKKSKSFQANNDGGIDDLLGTSKDVTPINPEECIVKSGKVIGFYTRGKVFVLGDIRSYTQYDEEREAEAGPYGEDIVYSTQYTVIPEFFDLDAYLQGREEIGHEFIAYGGISSVKVPPYVKKIDSRAFYNCGKLTEVYMDECGVTEIKDNTFSESPIKKITFPKGLKKIEHFAFARCPLCDIELPDTLETIGKEAFGKCTGIDNLILPAGVSTYNSFVGVKMNVFFKGDRETFLDRARDRKIAFCGSDVTLYCYSEISPENPKVITPAECGIDNDGIYGIGYWHYVDGKATPWS